MLFRLRLPHNQQPRFPSLLAITTFALLTVLVCLLGVFAFAGRTSASADKSSVASLPSVATLAPCDPVWQIVESPIITGSKLTGVSVISANDIWAVGEYSTDPLSGDALTMHWDGGEWQVVPSLTHENTGYYPRKVEAIATNDVWVVGYRVYFHRIYNFAMHWDGKAWSEISTPEFFSGRDWLYDISAVASDDIWAVGYQTNPNNPGMIIHWDGTSWTEASAPETTEAALHAVSAISTNDVWAVGARIIPSDTVTVHEPLIKHWGGSTWSTVPGPGLDNGQLFDVSALSGDDAWAIGSYDPHDPNLSSQVILHWDGVAWSRMPNPDIGTLFYSLSQITAVAANDVWAIGSYYNGTKYRPMILRWNGIAWSMVDNPIMGTNGDEFAGIDAVSATDVWAVGTYYEPEDFRSGLIEHYAPPPPTQTPTPLPTQTPGGPTATPEPPQCTIAFTDVAVCSTFYSYIQCMACRGIIDGYTSGCDTGSPCFRPEQNVTRGQLAKIVANAAGFGEPGGKQQYEDVPPGSTFFAFVWRLSDRGIITGYLCGGEGEPCGAGNLPYYRPNSTATRGQISKIISNAVGFDDPPGEQIFEDVAPGSSFYDYVQRLSVRGIISGYPCGLPGEPCVEPGNRPYFRAVGNATRGQTSKLVANTFFPNCSILPGTTLK